MPALTVSRKQPSACLLRVKGPPDSNHTNQAANHGSRKRNVERLCLSAFGFRHVKHPTPQIQVFDASLLDRVGAMPREQQEQVEFPTYCVVERRQLGEPAGKVTQS